MSETIDKLEISLKQWPLFDVETRLSFYKDQLQSELRDRGICFDFHMWVSDEWFCPDGVPGFAVPFYLFNPELAQIHREQTGKLEGRTDHEILKLMRHELGHAIDNAFALRKNETRQNVFGSSEQSYPEFYDPQKYSRNFVHYLGENYAQSHPDEDFAETFAYWLDPKKNWQLKSFSKILNQKFVCMTRLMREVKNRQPILKNKYQLDPIEKNNQSLGEFYEKFHKSRNHKHFKRLDRNIRVLFPQGQPELRGVSLAAFLRKERTHICRRLSSDEGIYQYEAKRVLEHTIRRAESLGVAGNLSEFKRKSPTLLQRNFRYLKEKDQLRFYL